jgi:hypothetical protein
VNQSRYLRELRAQETNFLNPREETVIGDSTTGDEAEEEDENHRVSISTFSLIANPPVPEGNRPKSKFER